jgi:hypothetical protein
MTSDLPVLWLPLLQGSSLPLSRPSVPQSSPNLPKDHNGTSFQLIPSKILLQDPYCPLSPPPSCCHLQMSFPSFQAQVPGFINIACAFHVFTRYNSAWLSPAQTAPPAPLCILLSQSHERRDCVCPLLCPRTWGSECLAHSGCTFVECISF